MSPGLRRILEDSRLVLTTLAAVIAIFVFVITYVVPFTQSAMRDLRASVTSVTNALPAPFATASLTNINVAPHAGASMTNEIFGTVQK